MSLSIMRVIYRNDLYDRFVAAGAFENVQAVISSNLKYMLALEYGHSQQAPVGMIRAYRNEYRAIVYQELQQALFRTGYDHGEAARLGITEAALRILVKIVERTPVDTGRAKGSWIVTLPGGRTSGGKTISEDQQRLKAASNRIKRRKAAKRDAARAEREAKRATRAARRRSR